MFKRKFNFTKFHHRIFTISTSFVTFLVILNFINNVFKIVDINPVYLEILQQILLVYVSLFLMIRFNPFKKFENKSLEITEFEATVAFHASFLLILSTVVIKFTEHFLKMEETKIVKDVEKK